ncbi:MAG: hypothetical protein ACOVSW_10520 [Candidatus Kapaibacteriota bacterium]
MKFPRWFSDEMRFGLHTAHKRQWTLCGIRPKWTTKLCYDFGYLYVAIEPLRDDLIAAFLPDMTPESHQAFLDFVADEVETGIALYQNQAGTHRTEEVISASHVHIGIEKRDVICFADKAHHIFLRYCPPTSYNAPEIRPKLHTFAASISSAKMF